jgi:hypothetical protein
MAAEGRRRGGVHIRQMVILVTGQRGSGTKSFSNSDQIAV